jgi:hypothetical protein
VGTARSEISHVTSYGNFARFSPKLLQIVEISYRIGIGDIDGSLQQMFAVYGRSEISALDSGVERVNTKVKNVEELPGFIRYHITSLLMVILDGIFITAYSSRSYHRKVQNIYTQIYMLRNTVTDQKFI